MTEFIIIKEKDSETGYSYFGARYYSSEGSFWLSVDPLADKYPSMSAYMYTAGNPVMLVDPDGMETIKMDDEFGINGEKVSDYGGDKTDYHHQKNGTVVIKDHKSGKEKGSMPVGAFYAGKKINSYLKSENSVSNSTSASSTATSGNLSQSNTDDGPALDFELNINFGLAYKEKINVFGLNEKVELNVFSVDLMTWNWDSDNPLNIQYTPYRSAYSSVDFGGLIFGGGGAYDWSVHQASANGHVGMLEGSTNGPPRFTVFDIGGQFGFGVNVKMTANPQKVMNSYLNVCNGYHESFPSWRSFMH